MEYTFDLEDVLMGLANTPEIYISTEEKRMLFYLTNLNFKLLHNFRDQAEQEQKRLIPDLASVESAVRDNLLEILSGILKGVPMYRAQRTFIENIARLVVTLQLQTNLLNNPTQRRTDENNKQLDKIMSRHSPRSLTDKFLELLSEKSINYGETYNSLYTELNDFAHANYQNVQYTSFIESYTEELPSRLSNSIEVQQKLLSISLDTLLHWTEDTLRTDLLTRSDFAMFKSLRYSNNLTYSK